MDMLELRGIDKLYRSRGKVPVHAVRALDMAVEKGEIVALLGSSGCGKTSTLRMIAGFEDVSAGSIALGGRPIHVLPPARRKVAMAFEGYSLYPPLTVRENIAFALKSAQLPRSEVTRRVDEIARLVEIEDILDKYPRAISGGQQQRVSLARALVRDADLYLLDEPMGQLEPQLRAVLRGRIKSLLAERGMTAIFVTHDQTEASALADRIAVMEGGVLQFAFAVEELFVGRGQLGGACGHRCLQFIGAGLQLRQASGFLTVCLLQGNGALLLEDLDAIGQGEGEQDRFGGHGQREDVSVPLGWLQHAGGAQQEDADAAQDQTVAVEIQQRREEALAPADQGAAQRSGDAGQ